MGRIISFIFGGAAAFVGLLLIETEPEEHKLQRQITYLQYRLIGLEHDEDWETCAIVRDKIQELQQQLILLNQNH